MSVGDKPQKLDCGAQKMFPLLVPSGPAPPSTHEAGYMITSVIFSKRGSEAGKNMPHGRSHLVEKAKFLEFGCHPSTLDMPSTLGTCLQLLNCSSYLEIN